MKKLPLIALLATVLTGCSTTDATSLPFDLASTTKDGVSSLSSSSDGDGSDSSAALEQERYVASQIEWIQRDAARGHGESLQALAQLLGEPDADSFAAWTQDNYDLLFAELTAPEELLTRIATYR